MKLIRIKFWAKDTGNLMSHKEGITKEQVEEFKTLEEGDRLILYREKREKESDAHYTLRVYKKVEDKGEL